MAIGGQALAAWVSKRPATNSGVITTKFADHGALVKEQPVRGMNGSVADGPLGEAGNGLAEGGSVSRGVSGADAFHKAEKTTRLDGGESQADNANPPAVV